MTRKCDLTGKKSMVGNNVSHANNKTKKESFFQTCNQLAFIASAWRQN